MRVKVLALLAAFTLVCGVAGVQAQNTAQLYGRVTDSSGAVMPGVTVTLSSPVLLQPLTAVTGATGTYQFPGLGVGTYTVK
ncbi:MAG TPA: carboxypeptidase-like regulatory domain-containing protein, partial [Vicinamibacterales bacterium]|nr:carboxypeptidase-like regulatory domain-containing protein [Vicinamibacterales bacterium]